MVLNQQPGVWGRATALFRPVVRVRYLLLAAALVLIWLGRAGPLSLPQVLVAWLLIAAAALITARSLGRSVASAAATSPASAAEGDLLRRLVGGLPDPVLALGRDERVVAFNDKVGALFPALRVGEPFFIALRIPDLMDAIRRAAATGEPQRVEFSERVPVDRWHETLVTPISLTGEARAQLLLVTFHDLTPLRRVEEMRADFVANASHELRTPLATLSGFIDTLRGPAREDAPARERFLEIMHAQATRMARLIDDLLSLSRIELNAHLRPQTRVDLVAIIGQVVDSLQTLARDRETTVTIEAPAPLTVLGDRDELLRVFDNLVENAIKYAASGKRVEIRAAAMPAPNGELEAQVAVKDYGPGIAPEHLPRLTERFYRVDVVDSRAQGGTGLGLALVKHILNRHGGRLTIESGAGQGATFRVHVPLIPEAGSDER
jgi:two-component system phosphate regulon sensor histidine kinase PhoR